MEHINQVASATVVLVVKESSRGLPRTVMARISDTFFLLEFQIPGLTVTPSIHILPNPVPIFHLGMRDQTISCRYPLRSLCDSVAFSHLDKSHASNARAPGPLDYLILTCLSTYTLHEHVQSCLTVCLWDQRQQSALALIAL